jgi:hypothetical protein
VHSAAKLLIFRTHERGYVFFFFLSFCS